MKNIIHLIAARQLELKYTNRAMAIAADITPDYYAQIIANKRPGVSYDIIQALANHVGLELLAVYSPEIMRKKDERKEQAGSPSL